MRKKCRTTKNELFEAALSIIKNESPKTIDELASLLRERYGCSQQQVEDLFLEMDRKNKLPLIRIERIYDDRTRLVSRKNAWFWITITFTVMTILTIFSIQASSSFVGLRSVLGIVFIIFLPGFSFMKTFVPSKTILSKENPIILAETIGFSIVMSLVLVTIIALLLNYTPWGITPIPLTTSISLLTLVLSVSGLIRDNNKI